MSFVCPDCLTPGALEITLSLRLPFDSRSDDIALQIVECSHCKFQGVAVYEESRRGALDSESWDHSGYRVAKDDLTALIETMRQCPRPSNDECQCPAHRALGRTDASGRWCGIDHLKVLGGFPMRLVNRPAK
jgi:hypothetical protein